LEAHEKREHGGSKESILKTSDIIAHFHALSGQSSMIQTYVTAREMERVL
jgi:hypothetical protein